jgi:hypothetical protein
MLRYTEHALSDLRIRVRSYYIRLNHEKGLQKYESIKEQFKRYQHLAKVYDKQATAASQN